jgi:hypothetical protein
LNKDANAEQTVRVKSAGQFDLTLRLPSRSYASVIVDDSGVVISAIGG